MFLYSVYFRVRQIQLSPRPLHENSGSESHQIVKICGPAGVQIRQPDTGLSGAPPVVPRGSALVHASYVDPDETQKQRNYSSPDMHKLHMYNLLKLLDVF